MCDKKINIRAAVSSDCEDIYVWRSDLISLPMFFDNSILSYKDHKKWFNSSLINADRKLYIEDFSLTKIGVCRFDYNKKNGRLMCQLI